MKTYNAHPNGRDHGGGLDAICRKFGGSRAEWLDLSTGINPESYPFPALPEAIFHTLPDSAAFEKCEAAARKFWDVPKDAEAIISPGLSLIIAQLPLILEGQSFHHAAPSYNEYRAGFREAGWVDHADDADVTIIVSPNNPDGRIASLEAIPDDKTLIIDESFGETASDQSLIARAASPNTLILKGVGKFWGLAGLRLGFAFGDKTIIEALKSRLGPWAVSGPALHIGAHALSDLAWVREMRASLEEKAQRLDKVMAPLSDKSVEGTHLFRLYRVEDAPHLFQHFCERKILTRIFPYDAHLIRLGLPRAEGFERLKHAVRQYRDV